MVVHTNSMTYIYTTHYMDNEEYRCHQSLFAIIIINLNNVKSYCVYTHTYHEVFWKWGVDNFVINWIHFQRKSSLNVGKYLHCLIRFRVHRVEYLQLNAQQHFKLQKATHFTLCKVTQNLDLLEGKINVRIFIHSDNIETSTEVFALRVRVIYIIHLML